ncbi:calvin cycle protein CP12-3, chloroplastic-like protein [Tanacetum coccineum]|uniref:Calvin cycle protein CP12-3, chloroplastic-like protein n=1 Tax=Tanacetum coccineum TaxID=301880 RepID=A0ABQ4WDS0_9ASTR
MYKGTHDREKKLTKMIENKVTEAKDVCDGNDGSDECKVAWDEVEEISQAKAHLRDKLEHHEDSFPVLAGVDLHESSTYLTTGVDLDESTTEAHNRQRKLLSLTTSLKKNQRKLFLAPKVFNVEDDFD